MNRLHWTTPRALALAAIGVAWLVAGFGVYLGLGFAAHRNAAASRASRPGQEPATQGPLGRLPGTLYLVQDGTLYRLRRGTFTPLLAAGGTASWSMPAVSPSGQNLVVVRRDSGYSDLYLVDASGKSRTQLTHDASSTVELNHWALYPRLGADGSTVWFSYDPKDGFSDYNVVLAVWSMSLGGAADMRRWTTPNDYTGGDVQPVPLASGGLIYTKYALDTSLNRIMGQLWLAPGAGEAGQALTPSADDCSQPALSPDGSRLAMICTGGTQVASVQVAAFDGAALGPRQVVVSGQLAAQPTWSPDGQSLVYVAAQGISGHFQLWLQQVPSPHAAQTGSKPAQRGVQAAAPNPAVAASSPTPTPLPQPVQLTSNLDFDATSTIAWHV